MTTLAAPAPETFRVPSTLTRLRPYQVVIAREIMRRLIHHEGGSISVEIARQGGKNELSAQIEFVTLFAHHQSGGTLVKCAPTAVPQARISQERLRAKAVEARMDGLLHRSGNTISYGHAKIDFLSAEPTANVVGHTASLLLEVDEAQDVDPEKFDRDFRPMAAAKNAPVIYYGTPWSPGSLPREGTRRAHRGRTTGRHPPLLPLRLDHRRGVRAGVRGLRGGRTSAPRRAAPALPDAVPPRRGGRGRAPLR